MRYNQTMTESYDPKFYEFSPEEQKEIKLITKFFGDEILPTEAGRYYDNIADIWTLNADGTWTDEEGETRPTSDNWYLVAAIAPFTRIE